MTVYVLTCDIDHDMTIEGAFSTLEKAEKALKEYLFKDFYDKSIHQWFMQTEHYCEYHITEVEVD